MLSWKQFTDYAAEFQIKTEYVAQTKNFFDAIDPDFFDRIFQAEKLDPEDKLGDTIRNGTLSVGFCGLSECLKALTGKHHGESEESQELGLKIIKHMRKRMDDEAERTKYNWSLFATPAESVAGRFCNCIKKKYGELEGISDKEYLTNSVHVDVSYNCSMTHKVNVEAPYHELCNAG